MTVIPIRIGVSLRSNFLKVYLLHRDQGQIHDFNFHPRWMKDHLHINYPFHHTHMNFLHLH